MKKNKNKRECGDCTACCEGWLVINTNELKACPGSPCKNAIKGGCAIYETRPENPCRNFNCSWVVTDSSMPDWLKPDNAKAIIVNQGINWRGNVFDLVLPVGRKVPQRTLNWLSANAQKQNQSYIYAEHEFVDGVYTGAKSINVFAQQPLRGQLMEWLGQGNTLW